MIDDVFNSASYMVFLETIVARFFGNNRLIRNIQDRASYHKDGDIWNWFKEYRKWIEVYNLPSYSREFNAVETLWKYARKKTTHNATFESKNEVINCVTDIFEKIKIITSSIDGAHTLFKNFKNLV